MHVSCCMYLTYYYKNVQNVNSNFNYNYGSYSVE